MKSNSRTRRVSPALAALALLAAWPAAAQDSVRVVSLEQAVAMALEVDPGAVAAAGAETTAAAELRQARAAFLPSLFANSSYGNSSNERFDQATGRLQSESYTANLSLGYDIFTGGRRVAEQRSARAVVGAASARRRAQRFETVLATQRSFYGAAAAAELVAAAEQRLARARQQLSFAQTRIELGSATRSDLLRAELEVGNAELAVVDAQSAQRRTRLELGRQIGVESEVRPAAGVLPAAAPDLPAVATLAARAERTAPEAVAARAELRAAEAERWSARTAYLPTLRLTSGYDWSSFDFPPRDEAWSLRLTASVPIFNGLARETNIARARVAERNAQARERDARIGVRIAAEDATREIAAAERRVEIAARAVVLAQEDLRVQEERYRIGNSTILDLQTSQVALAEAETASVRARQALATAVGQLEAVLGETIPDLSRALDEGEELP